MNSLLQDYKKLLFDCKIIDPNTSTRGTFVWMPDGIIMRDILNRETKRIFSKYNYGEYLFPVMVAKEDFSKILDGIFDFSKAVFWVNGERVLRPSGESLVYPQFRKWITSYRDLPIRMYQIGSSFRNGPPRSLFRLNEADPFIEGHTAHSSEEDALKQLDDNVKIQEEILDYFALPVIITHRPVWDNKPVSEINVGFDTIIPTGETILIGSAYYQNQIFSKLYDVKFKNSKDEFEYTYQTSIGYSVRLIFTSLLLSMDEKGLNILPDIAPYQIVIIPINKDNNDEVNEYIDKVFNKIKELGYRVRIDNSDDSLKNKHILNEKKGVPIRIEIGKNEMFDKTLKIISRASDERKHIKFTSIKSELNKMILNSNKIIRDKLNKFHEDNIISNFKDINHLCELVNNGKVVKTHLCFNEKCCKEIEKKCFGEVIGYSQDLKDKSEGKCIICNQKTSDVAFLSRHL